MGDGKLNWPTLMYIGTVMLRRSEPEFWRMTLRKLLALHEAHVHLHGLKKQE